MSNLCDRHDSCPFFGMLNTKCFVKPQFANAKFLIELCYFLFKFFCTFRSIKCLCKVTDTVTDSLIEDLSMSIDPLVIPDHGKSVFSKYLSKILEIIVKQFFKNLKIMQCCNINTSFDRSDNLTGSAVCILMTDHKVSQISMPQISFKSVTD